MVTLILCMPPGSALGYAMGGDMAWSHETRAAYHAGWLVAAQNVALKGGKRKDLPEYPRPPEPGWRKQQAAAEDRKRRKAESWMRRNGLM